MNKNNSKGNCLLKKLPGNHFLRIMRTSIILLFTCVFCSMAESAFTQNAKVTINKRNASIKEVLNEIETQTDYLFIYNNEVNTDKKVSVRAKSESVSDVLNNILRATDIRYTMEGNHIILFVETEEESAEDTNALLVQQQKKTITGKVVDINGEPIIGANIVEVGTTNGTVTDIDGNFSLDVAEDAVIRISYIGYMDQQINTKGKTNFNIVLQEDIKALEEVVVVGYGTMRKSDLTGAISSVDREKISKRNTYNLSEALQGQVAGINIQKFGGNAGAGLQMKIRGVKTFGDNEPLYIIDGFPGDINNVSPQDILSMEILKDAAAAAIYGSRAANGVVLITTKGGEKGDVRVEFNSYLSVTNIAKKLELLNASEYRDVHRQMYENWNMFASSEDQIPLPPYITKESDVDTDWQGAMQRNGLAQNYTISVRGASDKSNYSIFYNRVNEKGVFLGNDYRHDNARAKLSLKKNIFQFDANLIFKYTDNRQPQYSLKEMYMISPLVPIYDESQPSGFGLTNFDGLPNNRNVMADYHFRSAYDKSYLTTGNVSLTINFTDWLNIKSNYQYQGEHERTMYHEPVYVADIRSKNEYPYHSEGSYYWESQIFENILSANRKFKDHSFNIMLGNSVDTRSYQWNWVSAEGKTLVYNVENNKLVTEEKPSGFLDPNFSTIGAGKGGTFSGDGSKWEYRRVSFFGRLNYNYADRYLFQGTFRYDGSSKFGSENRWGTFPSIAFGWRISEEEFFPEDAFFTNLKLRASWGRLGNESALGYYDFLALISTYNTKYQGYVKGIGENPWPGSIARGLENRTLKWETTDSKNIGFDFSFLQNKMTGTLNYYNNETSDLLITKVLPPSAGLNNPVLNVGKIRNSGVELELNWNDVVNADFNYGAGFNVSSLKNKVLNLADENQVIYGEGLKYGTEHFPTQTRVGMPIGAFYLYKTDGLFQNEEEVNLYKSKDGNLLQPNAHPGDIRFKDINNDGVIDENDKEYCGSGMPKVEANLNLTMQYKGFDLFLLFSSAWGHKLYNGNKYFYEGMNSGSNFLKSTLKAWTPTNTSTKVPRAVYQDPNGNLRESDRFLEKGDFIRLRQLQLGYSIPQNIAEKMYLNKLRFYVSGENLFTITSYEGIDPEFARSSVLNSGIDRHIYPFTRSYTFGLQLTF
jgi:TonB-linked SusC/RagA family outer membrane protein